MYNVWHGQLGPAQAQNWQMVSDELTKALREGTLEKAYTTGSSIVTPGAGTDASNLRKQFLVGGLVDTLYSQDDAVTMKLLPVRPVGSTVVEFSRFDQYGGAGDGFVGESGDGSFGVASGDDAFSRQTRTVKFLAAQRQVGVVIQEVNNLEDPVAAAERGATMEIIRNANLGLLFGDSGFNSLAYDGIWKQLYDYVVATGDTSLWIDMNNQPVTVASINAAATNVRRNYGRGSCLVQSAGSYNDTETQLLGQERAPFGFTGTGGIDMAKVKSVNGIITRYSDPMLRENRPLAASGIAGEGNVRATADTGALSFSATPWSTGAGNTVVATAGTGPYYVNATRSSDATSCAVPALPTSNRGNGASSHLVAGGNYYYAAAVVINGKESQAWVLGASAVNDVTSAAPLSPSATQVCQLKLLVASVSGYSAALRTQIHFRIYRTGNLSSAPTLMSQFTFLMQVAVSAAGTSTLAFDNGMYIPGTTVNFLLTEKRDGKECIIIGQLLEMMKRPLAPLALADQFAYLAFLTPIVFWGGFHAVFYNVRANAPYTT